MSALAEFARCKVGQGPPEPPASSLWRPLDDLASVRSSPTPPTPWEVTNEGAVSFGGQPPAIPSMNTAGGRLLLDAAAVRRWPRLAPSSSSSSTSESKSDRTVCAVDPSPDDAPGDDFPEGNETWESDPPRCGVPTVNPNPPPTECRNLCIEPAEVNEAQCWALRPRADDSWGVS